MQTVMFLPGVTPVGNGSTPQGKKIRSVASTWCSGSGHIAVKMTPPSAWSATRRSISVRARSSRSDDERQTYSSATESVNKTLTEDGELIEGDDETVRVHVKLDNIARAAAYVGGGAGVLSCGMLASEGMKLREERMSQAAIQGVPPPPPREYYADTPLGRLAPPLLMLQVVALLGASVGGALASVRRRQLANVYGQLREVTKEMRERMEAAEERAYAELESPPPEKPPSLADPTDEEDPNANATGPKGVRQQSAATRQRLESILQMSSAAHPTEIFASGRSATMAQSMRECRSLFKRGEAALKCGEGSEALGCFSCAASLAADIASPRMERRALRGQAKAHAIMGRYDTAILLLRTVEASIEAAGKPKDSSVCGEIADYYAEVGNLELAGKWYDITLEAMQVEAELLGEECPVNSFDDDE